jgi:hypothetical protein
VRPTQLRCTAYLTSWHLFTPPPLASHPSVAPLGLAPSLDSLAVSDWLRMLACSLQTHDASWQKQYASWSQLIRDYCKAKRIFVLTVNDASTSELFTNAAIGRALPIQSIIRVLDRLVLEGIKSQQLACPQPASASGRTLEPQRRRCHAGYGQWEDGGKERCTIYWRKPDEWADMIAQRVVECGFQDQIFTIYDVLHGDFSSDTGQSNTLG